MTFCFCLIFKIISIFLSITFVSRFQNSLCTTEMPQTGTCYTPNECSDLGGIASQSCASGFGVCCICKNCFWLAFYWYKNLTTDWILVKIQCGQSSSQNCTYFESPGLEQSGPCRSQICRLDNICQVIIATFSLKRIQLVYFISYLYFAVKAWFWAFHHLRTFNINIPIPKNIKWSRNQLLKCSCGQYSVSMPHRFLCNHKSRWSLTSCVVWNELWRAQLVINRAAENISLNTKICN